MKLKNKKILICVAAIGCVAVIATVAIILSVVLKKPSDDAPNYYNAVVRLKLGETVADPSGNTLRMDSVELTKAVTFDDCKYTSEKGGFIVFYGETKFIDVYEGELITQESIMYKFLQQYISIIGQINESDAFWTDEEETEVTDEYVLYGREDFVLRKDLLLEHFVQNGVVNGKAALVYEVSEEILQQFKTNVEKFKGVEIDEADSGIITFAIHNFTMKSGDPLCRHIFWSYRILADDITINL